MAARFLHLAKRDLNIDGLEQGQQYSEAYLLVLTLSQQAKNPQ